MTNIVGRNGLWVEDPSRAETFGRLSGLSAFPSVGIRKCRLPVPILNVMTEWAYAPISCRGASVREERLHVCSVHIR